MQRNNTPILIGAVLFGLLALGLTTFMLMGRKAAPPPGPPPGPTPVPIPKTQWVAINDIPPRTEITRAMLREKIMPEGTAASDAIHDPSQLEGMLTKGEVRSGEPVTTASFAPRLQRVMDANIEIPQGFRGVGIWVDPDQTAAGLVDAGDRVDVISTHRLTWDKAPRQYVAGAVAFTTGRTIAQDLLVLGVDKSIKSQPTPTPVPNANGMPAAAGPPPPPPPPAPPPQGPIKIRLLLAAPPLVAEQLVAANDQGTLHITIRRPTERGAEPNIPETRQYPSRLYNAPPERTASAGGRGNSIPDFSNLFPKPPKAPQGVPLPNPLPPVNMGKMEPPGREITVIRGTEKTRVIVPGR